MLDNKIFINRLTILLIFFIPISIAAVNIISSLLVIAFIVDKNKKERILTVKFNKMYIFYLLWIFMLLISLLWSDSIHNGYWRGHYSSGLTYFFGYLFLYIFIAFIILLYFDKKNTNNAINSFVFSMLFSEILSYGMIFNVWHINAITPPSPFLSHSEYTTFVAIAVFILIDKFKYEENKFIKFVLLFFIITATSNIFLNGGRTGQAGFFIMLFIYLIYKYKLTFKSIIMFTASTLLVFLVAYNTSELFKKRIHTTLDSIEQMENNNYMTSIGLRYKYILIGLESLKDNHDILLGHGFGDSKLVIKDYVKKYHLMEMVHMHNQFIQTLVDTGLVGFAFLILFLIYYFRAQYDEHNLKTYSIILMVLLLCASFGYSITLSQQSYILLCVMLSVFMLNMKDTNTNHISKASN